jgi:AcrR family transcriptional regulator
MRTRSKGQAGGGGFAVEGEAGDSCETQRAILDAARSRFLHYGYKKTTIDEIAVDAKVGKGTVYLYFDSKEDILLTIVREVKKNITDQMRCIAGSLATPEEKIRRMIISALVAVHDASSATAHGVELVDELLQPKVALCGMEEKEKQLALLSSVLREGVRRGELSVPNDDTDRAARHLMLAMVSFFPPNIKPCHSEVGCRGSLEMQAGWMLDFLFHGLRARR